MKLDIPDEIKTILNNEVNWSETSEDEPICQKCKERVTKGIPLRMWKQRNGETVEISFHIKCVWPEAITSEEDEEEGY